MATKEHKIVLIVSAKNLATKVLGDVSHALGGIGKIAAGILGAKAIEAIGKQIVTLGQRAGQVQDVSVAFENLANSVGMSSNQMLRDLQVASKGTVNNLELMRTANQAVLLTGGILAKDLPQYFKIASVAARASGQDIGFLFDSLVRGVARGSPMIIDNALIALDAASAMETYAKKIGKTTEQFTKQDQQMATHQAVLAAGAAMMAKVGDASGSLSMQFQQLLVRGQNLRDELASRLAPAMSVVMDGLIGAADKAEQAGRAFVSKFGGQMMQAAESALRWGVNIATQLASGIVQGASSALIAAMNWIGGLLSSWLSPGSPPKVAPNIDRWGMAAMEQFLQGFQEADFSALQGVQGPLQQALNALVDMGQLDSDAMGSLFSSLSVDIAGVIDQFNRTGQVGGAVFDKLLQVGGQFGDHLVNILRGQLDISAATRALADAQERLNRAREKESEAEDRIKTLKNEYFAMRKAGASPAALKAKLAEIKAQQQTLKAARAEGKEAEKAEQEAKKKLDPLQKQLHLQEQMVQQLAQLAQMQARTAATALGGAGAGALGGLGGAIALPVPETSAFMGGLQTAFENAKAGIKEKLAGIFQPLKDAWEQQMKPALDALGEKWTWFKGILTEFWNSEPVKNIREWIANLFPEGTAETIGKWAGKVLVVAAALGILALIVSVVTSPLVLLGAAIVLLAGLWTRYGGQITTTVEQLVFIIGYKLQEWRTKLGELWAGVVEWATNLVNKFTEFKESAAQVWTDIKDAIATKVEEIKTAVTTKIEELFASMGLDLDEMKEKWSTIWADVELIAGEVWGRIVTVISEQLELMWTFVTTKFTEFGAWWSEQWTAIQDKLAEILTNIGVTIGLKVVEWYTSITGKIQEIKDWIGLQLQPFVDLGAAIINGVKDGVLGAAGNLIAAATEAVQNALNAAKEALGIDSPSKVAARIIGGPIMAGIAQGIESNARLPGRALGGSLDSAMRGVFAPGAGGMGMPAFAAAGGGGRGGDLYVVVEGDVWSDRKVDEIANAIDRRKRLKGGARRF